MCVCVWGGMDAFVCRVCVYIKMCVNLSSRTAKVSPDTHYFHITAWAWFLLFSFCRPPSLTYIYRHKTTAFPTVCSLSICLSLTLEREEEEEPEYKCTQTYLTQAERLLHFSYNSYTGNKKTKKRRKGKKKRRFNYFGINALVTKYRHLFFCLFSLMFSFAHLFLK